jgi:hypothetical protein
MACQSCSRVEKFRSETAEHDRTDRIGERLPGSSILLARKPL